MAGVCWITSEKVSDVGREAVYAIEWRGCCVDWKDCARSARIGSEGGAGAGRGRVKDAPLLSGASVLDVGAYGDASSWSYCDRKGSWGCPLY